MALTVSTDYYFQTDMNQADIHMSHSGCAKNIVVSFGNEEYERIYERVDEFCWELVVDYIPASIFQGRHAQDARVR